MDLQCCFCVGATPGVMQRSSRKADWQERGSCFAKPQRNTLHHDLVNSSFPGQRMHTMYTERNIPQERPHFKQNRLTKRHGNSIPGKRSPPQDSKWCCIHLATPRANCENRMVYPTIASPNTALCTQWLTLARMKVERGAVRHFSFFIWLRICWACRHP